VLPVKNVDKQIVSRSTRDSLLFHGFGKSNGEDCEQVL